MDRSEKLHAVLWITGISGAGKSTIAGLVHDELINRAKTVVWLDGDEIRKIFGKDLGHDKTDRITNALRICRLASLISRQGHIVVCSTMSLFPEIWHWNRENLENYFEVYLKVSLQEARQRDRKGVYLKVNNVVGYDLALNEPPYPHLVIENNDALIEQLQARAIYIVDQFEKCLRRSTQ